MAKHARDIHREIEKALADPVLRQAMTSSMERMRARRKAVMPDNARYEVLRERARAIKDEALGQAETLIAEFAHHAAEAGAVVVRPSDGKAARAYVSELARSRGVSLITKSKSMTCEEIHLTQALEAAGIEVVEGDLGERVIQLAGERPSHLVVPAIHKKREEIVALLSSRMGVAEPPSSAEGLTQLMRSALRPQFLRAQMGITGANFGIAETGSIVLVENEGNASLTSQLPPIHVALIGWEKIIPRVTDLAVFLELLPRSATGQKLTSYVSLLTGQQAAPLPGGSTRREFHLLILDNGRGAAAADPELVEALRCIRCGACLNACAPYNQVGGHVYGGDPYPGGIGCAWTYITGGSTAHEAAWDFNGLCTTCSRCTEVCPVKIDIPWLNTVIKARSNEEFGAGLRQRLFARADLLGKAFSRASPVSDIALRTPIGRWSFGLLGIDPDRRMPKYEHETFLSWWKRRQPHAADPSSTPTTRVALFLDCFMNHNLPMVGRATVKVLEHAGIEITVAHNSCCGRPALSQGLLDKPRQWAADNLAECAALVADGYDIVCIEPSCLSTLRDDYERLLRETRLAHDHRLATLREHVFDITEYLVLLQRSGRLSLRFARPDASVGSLRFVVHGHCHQKTLGIGSTPAELLRLIPGAAVHEVDVLCCGMVGSFGYKKEYSALSKAMGLQLFESLKAQAGLVVTCGISCRSQIEMGTGRAVIHPVEALADSLVHQ